MQLDFVISMASQPVRLQFLAMERSLRAVGCHVPLRVIPYDDQQFDLPANASWWLDSDVARWLAGHAAHPTMRKYQCLLVGNYHFADSDIIFMRDPGGVIADQSGLMTACTEWNKPFWTFTPSSSSFFYRRSSTWQRKVFSTGQFALDRPLYSRQSLLATAESAESRDACLDYPTHEQPGLNQLVIASGVEVTNLTLPPNQMASTWAGDYPGAFEPLWADLPVKPYLIHWAGGTLDQDLPINEIFYSYLTHAERAEWNEQRRVRALEQSAQFRRKLPLMARMRHDAKQVTRLALRKVGVKLPTGWWSQRRGNTASGGAA
jgi:hypothetical protein